MSTATGVTPADTLQGGGASSGVLGVHGGGEGDGEGESIGKGNGKGKGKGKGSAEEGKGSGGVAVAPLGGMYGAGTLGLVAGAAPPTTTTTTPTEKYNWMPSLRESKPSRECIRRVRKDIRTLMR